MNFRYVGYLFLIFAFTQIAWAMPPVTTYQAKIVKPDGYPLEAPNVNFKFSFLDPSGSCILYSESYFSVNMAGTGGLISFPLGSGTRSYPTSGTMTLSEIFNNRAASFTCAVGGPASYTPLANDTRKIIMQFHDGTSWQTLPAMAINSVPYAMYAGSAEDSFKLNGKADTDFVEKTTIPSCVGGEVLTFNGVSFSCVAGGSSVTSSTVVAALGYTPMNGASYSALASSLSSAQSDLTAVSSSVYAVSSTVSSLNTSMNAVSGSLSALTSTVLLKANNLSDLTDAATARTNLGLGTFATANSVDLGSASATGTIADARLANQANITSGTQYTKVTVDGKGRVTSGAQLSANDVTTALGYTPQASGVISSQWNTSGTTINYTNGHVGIGTIDPQAALEISGAAVKKLILRDDQNGVSQSSIISFEGATDGAHGWVGFASTVDDDLSILAQGAGGDVVLGAGNSFSKGLRIKAATGNIGVGISAPVTRLDINGGVRISMEAATCAVSYAGTLRYNAGNVEFCNGTTWSAFGVSGAGLQSLNGSTSGTQTFANGTAGNSPAFVSANGVHTLNIPLASAAVSVTAGLISNADYVNFNNKITSSAASVAQVLGYTPANSATVATLQSDLSAVSASANSALLKANNLSDLTNVATARTNLGLGTFATANTVDLGSASATGIIADARLANQSNVSSGTQYTKVTVDGKGRVVSGAQLSSADVTTALGFTPGAAASGVTLLNGSASQTQIFAVGTTGNSPTFVTANGVHTLNIPLASAAGSVTAGLISNTDYINFNSKITSSAASIAQVLGYTPASATSLGNYLVKANNLSDLTSSATARTNLGLGTLATADTIDLGSASATGIIADARMPNQVGVTSGTQYTKVTVDGKGRVTSGAQLSSSDVTTALGYTPAASGVVSSQWSTSGTSINYMTGKVGIGITTPSALLHVSGGANVEPSLTYGSPATAIVNGGLQDIAFGGATTTSPWSAWMQVRSSANAAGSLSLNPLGGNVGIGTSAPTTRLDLGTGVGGVGLQMNDQQIKIVTSSFNSGSQYFYGATQKGFISAQSSGLLMDTTSSTIPLNLQTSGGNIGIGTTAPSAKLHLAAGTASTASFKLTSGTLLTSPQSGTIEYDGFNFYVTNGANVRSLMGSGAGGGTVSGALTQITDVMNASGTISLAPATSVIVSSTTASTDPTTGALVIKGGVGVYGNLFTSGTITSLSSLIGPYIYGSTVSGGSLVIDSTSHASKGNITLAPNGGGVGIGMTPTTSNTLTVSGNMTASGRMIASVVANSSALASITADFKNTNFIRATGTNANCGTLNVTNTSPGGTFTITIPNATATCTTINWNGAGTNIKLPNGYGSGGLLVSGVIYSFVDDGAYLWVSFVPY